MLLEQYPIALVMAVMLLDVFFPVMALPLEIAIVHHRSTTIINMLRDGTSHMAFAVLELVLNRTFRYTRGSGPPVPCDPMESLF
jgi:hypothetical protein